MKPIILFVVLHHVTSILSLSAFVPSSNHDIGLGLIIDDMKKATPGMDMGIAKDASIDCWLNALSTLEVQSFSNEEFEQRSKRGVKLSPGGNFCAHMRSGSGSHLDALAFELTKCEYERFNEPLPMHCSLEGRIASRMNNDASLRNCMSSLPKDTWVGIWTSFTQYKLSSYNICMKLTDELTLYRQQEAAHHLEKTMVDMEGKMDKVLLKADNQLEETVNLIGIRIEDMKEVNSELLCMEDMTNINLLLLFKSLFS